MSCCNIKGCTNATESAGPGLEYRPSIIAGPRLEYVGNRSIPLHCGRIEQRSINWPVIVFYWVINGRTGAGHWEAWPGRHIGDGNLDSDRVREQMETICSQIEADD